MTGVTTEASETNNPLENPEIAKRHAEQMAGSMAEVARLREIAVDSIAKASEKDASAFLETHAKDPRLANEVAKKLGYSNAKEIIDQINQPSPKTEDDFEKKYAQKRAEEKHEEAIVKAQKILDKIPEELREEAQTYFDDITEGKKLDEDKAIKFAEMATLYVNKDNIRAGLLDDSLAMLWSTWVWKSKKITEKEPQYVVRDGKMVLISNN